MKKDKALRNEEGATVQSLLTFEGHATDLVDLASDQGEISAVRKLVRGLKLARPTACTGLETSILWNCALGGSAIIRFAIV